MSASKIVVENCDCPQLSDWSISQSTTSFNSEIFNAKQSHSSKNQPKNLETLHKPVKCWTSMSPCLQGLLLGILMNGLVLAIVLTIWLTSHRGNALTTTNELPTGTILIYSGDVSTLTGSTYHWLLCDGSEVSRSTYQDLFNVIGVTYGSGNGSDTFNLPDFRARFPLGSNENNGSQLVSGGVSSHTLTLAEMPAHTHDASTLRVLYNGQHTHALTDPGHTHGGLTGSAPFGSGSLTMTSSGGAGSDSGVHTHTIPNGATGITIHPTGNHTHLLQGFMGVTGGNQPIDIMPPYQTVYYIIRT